LEVKMADVRGEPVERFKLSKDQKAFQIRFGELKEVSDMLEQATLVKRMELEDLREMWMRLSQEFQALPIPQNITNELSGMNFKEGQESPGQEASPDFRIRY